MGRRLALLIGTYEYRDTRLRQLIAPAHDAEALAAVLRDPAIAGFEVTTLINEPRHRVGQACGTTAVVVAAQPQRPVRRHQEPRSLRRDAT